MAILALPYTLPDPYTQADVAALNAFANSIYTSASQYGTFYDLTTQTAANTTTAYNVAIGNQDGYNGISLSGVGRITFTQPGIYHIGIGIQLANSDTAAHDVQIWLRKNGTDIPYSTSVYSVPAKHGTTEGHIIAQDSNIYQFAANDYIEVWWHTNNVTTYIVSLPASVTPVYPVAPSVVVDVLFAALT